MLFGVTVITGLVAPVLHEYCVAAPEAVSVTVRPEHTVELLLLTEIDKKAPVAIVFETDAGQVLPAPPNAVKVTTVEVFAVMATAEAVEPVLHEYETAGAEAVSVTELPAHMVRFCALNCGVKVTVTCAVFVPTQPAVLVPETV